MNIDLQVRGQRIYVKCEWTVKKPDHSFALGQLLRLCAAQNNSKAIHPDRIEPCELQFRPAMTRYFFSNLEPGTLYIEYEGGLEGAFLFMQPEIYHFSFYNGWYPVDFDAEEKYDMSLHAGDEYQLINGRYDPDLGLWRYVCDNKEVPDCNVLLLCKSRYHCVQQEGVSFWYFEPSHGDRIDQLAEHYASIREFYKKFYGHITAEDVSLVVLPEKYHNYGAYQRERLTVFSELQGEMGDKIHGLAHELGHIYGAGADTATWEDWLNETHAEWSALLYLRECQPQIFAAAVEWLEQNYKQSGTLRPHGDARPNEVHDTGTLIYYDIYKTWGLSEIEALLRIFDGLPTKDTEHFLQALKSRHPDSYKILLEKCREGKR